MSMICRNIIPVLTKEATKIVVMMELVFKLKVSKPMLSINVIFSFLITMFIMEISIVTELDMMVPKS
jgi:hypothetical protein